jgi:hypothetical protein
MRDQEPIFAKSAQPSSALPAQPVINFFADMIGSEAVPLMDAVLESVPLTVNGIQVVFRQPHPFLLDGLFGSVPVSSDLIPIHYQPPE